MFCFTWKTPFLFVGCSILVFSLVMWAKLLQPCIYKSDLRSTNILSQVSTIPRIKRIQVKPFLSNYIMVVSCRHASDYSFIITNIMSAWLCIISQPGATQFGCAAHRLVFSSTFHPRLLSWWIFPLKGVVLGSGVSGHPTNMRRRSRSLINTLPHPACYRHCSSDLTEWS